MDIMKKLGFTANKQVAAFLSALMSGQIIYSSFEAFKGSFYNVMLEYLNITNTELGILFTLIGSAMFFYIPAGWINNRFSMRSIMLFGLGCRLITMMVIILFKPGFTVLTVIAGSWGLIDAIFWPAVVNAISLLSGEHNKGIAFGLFESVRRLAETGMNALVIAAMAAATGSALMVYHSFTVVYTLLIIPMMFCVWRFVPNNVAPRKNESEKEKSMDALKGLVRVLRMPTVWFAALTSLTVYWGYIMLVYTVPYLQAVFGLSTAQAAVFGVLNASAMSILAGVISGLLADFIFKSSSKMMMIALGLTAACLTGVLLLPSGQNMLFANIVLLACCSFSVFLAKGIILSPIAEVRVDPRYNGAAMSVGSFAAYASIFWAYTLNGWIIDNNEAAAAYEKIFTIGVAVASCGFVISIFLLKSIRKRETVLKQAKAAS